LQAYVRIIQGELAGQYARVVDLTQDLKILAAVADLGEVFIPFSVSIMLLTLSQFWFSPDDIHIVSSSTSDSSRLDDSSFRLLYAEMASMFPGSHFQLVTLSSLINIERIQQLD
jgi:hypothetical protein